jgi:hypothetical protein
MQPQQAMKGLQDSLQPLSFVSFMGGFVQAFFFMQQEDVVFFFMAQEELAFAFMAQASELPGVRMHCVDKRSTITANMEAINLMHYKDTQTGFVEGSI